MPNAEPCPFRWVRGASKGSVAFWASIDQARRGQGRQIQPKLASAISADLSVTHAGDGGSVGAESTEIGVQRDNCGGPAVITIIGTYVDKSKRWDSG